MDKITFEDFGATIPVHIDQETIDTIVYNQLLQAAENIEYLKDPNDVDVWEALMVLIPFYATPKQKKEFADYQADQEWVNIVASKNA